MPTMQTVKRKRARLPATQPITHIDGPDLPMRSPGMVVVALSTDTVKGDVVAAVDQLSHLQDAGPTLRVLSYVVKHCRDSGLDWTPIRRADIAQDIGHSTRNISRALAVLLRHGYLARQSAMDGNCSYKVNAFNVKVA